MRLKDVVILRNEKTTDTSKPYIALENIISWDAKYIESSIETEGTNSVFKPNDILFGKLRPYLAKGFIPSYEGICSTEFFVLKAKKGYYTQYLLYLLLSHSFIDYIKNQVAGVKMPRTNWETFSSIEVSIPPLQVQQRIVEYLDAKTTEIDNKIELLGKKRDAYNRLKTATINRAVTRGLDEHVPLKDSGMDWIGQIPEHWEAARIKDVVSEIFMGTSPVYEYEEDNNNFVFGQRNNQLDGINFDDIKFAKDSFFNERQEYEFLKYGDVLINTLGGGSVGRTGYYDKNDDVRVITDGHIMVLRSKTYDTRYMYYYLLSRKERLENMAIGSTNQSFFNVSDVRVIPIPKPSLLEQKQIAAYLDERCAKIDAAVTIIDKQIDALKRLKRSLINEVVTGKRMV